MWNGNNHIKFHVMWLFVTNCHSLLEYHTIHHFSPSVNVAFCSAFLIPCNMTDQIFCQRFGVWLSRLPNQIYSHYQLYIQTTYRLIPIFLTSNIQDWIQYALESVLSSAQSCVLVHHQLPKISLMYSMEYIEACDGSTSYQVQVVRFIQRWHLEAQVPVIDAIK